MEKKNGKKAVKYIIIALAAVICVLVIIFGVFGSAGAETGEDSILSIKKTIADKALQCYVIEGAYPSELSYLEENYGLVVNKEDFYIVFRSEGQNLPPQITVAPKGGQKD